MPTSVVVAFVLLIAAAAMLVSEVWMRRVLGTSPLERAAGRVVYGAAAIAGATLLTALSGREWVLAVALVPLTTLCVLRFGGLVRTEGRLWERVALVGVVLAVGVAAALQLVPVPLTRAHLSGQPAAHPMERPSARPFVDAPVRG